MVPAEKQAQEEYRAHTEIAMVPGVLARRHPEDRPADSRHTGELHAYVAYPLATQTGDRQRVVGSPGVRRVRESAKRAGGATSVSDVRWRHCRLCRTDCASDGDCADCRGISCIPIFECLDVLLSGMRFTAHLCRAGRNQETPFRMTGRGLCCGARVTLDRVLIIFSAEHPHCPQEDSGAEELHGDEGGAGNEEPIDEYGGDGVAEFGQGSD